MDASKKMDASKVFFTGTVQDVKVTDSGTLFIKIETLIHENYPPLKYVVRVKREIADSIRVQPGDFVDVFDGTLYRVASEETIMVSVTEDSRIHVCAKDDGYIDAASELL